MKTPPQIPASWRSLGVGTLAGWSLGSIAFYAVPAVQRSGISHGQAMLVGSVLGTALQHFVRAFVIEIVGRHLNYYWRAAELVLFRRIDLMSDELFRELLEQLHRQHHAHDRASRAPRRRLPPRERRGPALKHAS